MAFSRVLSGRGYDRRLALGFGAIVLLLMLILSTVVGFLFTQLYEKEEDRLSSVLAVIFANSVSKVSFSGKYHARLFVEEIRGQIPALAFISVENRDGKVLAHSEPVKNDQYNRDEESARLRDLSLAGNAIVSADRMYEGQMVKEVVSSYRSELDNEVLGVVRIGIKMEEVQKEKWGSIVGILLMIVILTLLAIIAVWLLSRYFGGAHRALATQLRGILTYAPLIIGITNNNGQVLACSRQCERLFGSLPGGRSLGQFLDGHFPPDDIRKMTALNDEIFSNGRSLAREIEVEFHGGKKFLYISKFPIAHDDDGRPSLICTFIHDISERKRAERDATEAKEQWEKTFDAIADIVTIHDPEMRIVRANHAAGQMFQLEPHDLIGRFCYELFADGDQPCPGCPEQLSRLDLNPHQAVIRHCKLDKSYEVSTFPIVDEGQLSGFVHIAKDITKSLMLEEQLRQSQKMEAIGVLAGGIAHDFNNILTPILGYAEMALTNVEAGSSLRQELQQICVAADRAKDLVQQILGFSRQSAQDKKPFKPHLILKEVIKLLRSSLPTTIEFKTEIDQDCGTLLADPTQYHQIIMNLCTNAFHAMEQKGGILGIGLSRVTVRDDDPHVPRTELTPGDYILLSISDTGCGMEKSVSERIFEPYFTTKADGKGTGLGLSVVHGIVKSYKGWIGVYSEVGQGTTFSVYLPRMAEHAVPDVVSQKLPLPSGTGRILVVDDEEMITSMLKALLEVLGYQVTVANDSRRALALFEKQPSSFDLLLTDMTMPYMTGFELSQKVLLLRADLPIILCTGFSELINQEQAAAIGIRAYLNKPVSLHDLAQTLSRLLEQEHASA